MTFGPSLIAQQYWTQHLYRVRSSGPHNLDPTTAHGGISSALSVKIGDTQNDPYLMPIRPKM